MQLPLIKSLCEVFQVNRGSAPLKKKEIIQLLLTFLSSPDPGMTIPAEGKRRGRKPGSKNKKKVVKIYDDDDDMGESEDNGKIETEGGSPTNSQLKKWVKAYVNCFNLDKATAKHAVQTASDKFDVDLTERKGEIMDLLREAMS